MPGLTGWVSQPESRGFVEVVVGRPPLTRRSKSISGSSAAAEGKAEVAPNDMKSSVPLTFVPLVPDISWSFLVCSDSTRVERFLMSSMKDWNCCRLSRGPKLMLHKMGRMSMATNSVSAMPPICLRTFKAATATAGSFVFIARISGTIFSCMVYLSSGVDVVFLVVAAIPSSPSLLAAGSLVPPHRMTNASKPRTLIPKLLVLVKTDAITGKSSFFMVEKSRIGRTTGKVRSAASTRACVGDSMDIATIGRISTDISYVSTTMDKKPTVLEFFARTIYRYCSDVFQ
jgi:hypothetical protein